MQASDDLFFAKSGLDRIEFNRLMGRLRGKARVKKCLAEHEGSCKGKIVAAHSIQRGKILDSISSNGDIYHLGLLPADGLRSLDLILKKEGIGKFSTFSGFCGEHDKKLFQPIEDSSFSGSDKQQAIYALRACSKELHTSLEAVNFHVQTQLEFFKDLDKIPYAPVETPARVMAAHQRLNVADLKEAYLSISKSIQGDDYSDLESCIFSFDGESMIACSAAFIPYYDHMGDLILSEDEVDTLKTTAAASLSDSQYVFFNIFPENGKTYVLISFFLGSKAGSLLVDRLKGLSDLNLKVAFTNIALNYVENLALGPEYIKRFSESEILEIKKVFFESIRMGGRSFQETSLSIIL